jgi:hypothetical protein
MGILYKIPSWFLGYSVLFQLVFAIVSVLVAVYAYKIYKVSEEKNIKFFGYAFLLISLSYILWPVINTLAAFPISRNIVAVFLENNELSDAVAIYSHIVLFLAGLVTLVYSTLEKKNFRIYILLSVLLISIVLIALGKANLIYLLFSILIFLTLFHYVRICIKEKNSKVLLIMIAFAFLFLGTVSLIFSNILDLFYVSGHFFILTAYVLILTRLVINYRKQKRRG